MNTHPQSFVSFQNLISSAYYNITLEHFRQAVNNALTTSFKTQYGKHVKELLLHIMTSLKRGFGKYTAILRGITFNTSEYVYRRHFYCSETTVCKQTEHSSKKVTNNPLEKFCRLNITKFKQVSFSSPYTEAAVRKCPSK